MDKKTWRGVPWERFSKLLSCPLGGWIGGHGNVENAAPRMIKHDRHVQQLKRQSGDDEEIC